MAIHVLPLQLRVVRNARRRGVVVKRRKQWGTRFPDVYWERFRERRVRVKKADTLWQHITVTFDSGKLVGDFYEDMRTLERIGMERFGSGFSYNWGIDMKTGMVGEGQHLLAKGTHTVNDKGVAGYSYDQNHAGRAFAFIGMPGDKLSPKAIESAAQLFAAHMDEGALTQDPDYEPHSLVAAKDCPTNEVRNAMPKIRKRAHEVKRKKKQRR